MGYLVDLFGDIVFKGGEFVFLVLDHFALGEQLFLELVDLFLGKGICTICW